MPHLDFALRQHLLYRCSQIQKPQQVTGCRTASADCFCGIFMRKSEFFNETFHAERFFHHIEVLALHVLNQCNRQCRLVIKVADNCRNGLLSGKLGCTETPLTGNDFVLVGGNRADDDRTNHPLLTD